MPIPAYFIQNSLSIEPFISVWLFSIGSSFIKLQSGSIKIFNQLKCKQEYNTEKASIINEKVLCVGVPGKDICQVIILNVH